eukprot:231229_1
MIYLLYISWLFIAQSNDCYDGEFELNDLNECVFNCNENSIKYIAKTEVTFDQLLHSCYNVRRGFQLGDCTTLDDLVWNDSCTCPYCKCTDKDSSGSSVLFEQILDKTCYNCTCNTHPYDITYEG